MHFFVFRPEEYKKKVAEYVKKYATEEALRDACGGEVSVLYLIIHLDNYNPTIIIINHSCSLRMTSPPLLRAQCLTFLKMKLKTWSCNNKW